MASPTESLELFIHIPESIPGALERLSQYHWPGNVRELKNMIERSLILNPSGPIEIDEISANLACNDVKAEIETEPDSLLLDLVVSKHVQSVLEMTNRKISGEKGAAELLSINASALRHKMRKMNIPFGRNVYKKRAFNSDLQRLTYFMPD
jgi:DNA-binding NtrC family response regulator